MSLSNIYIHASKVVPATGDQQLLVSVNVTPGEIPRTPVHFVVVLDVSGSMGMDGRLANCVDSLRFVAKFLNESDYFSLITYSDDADMPVKCVRVDEAGRATIEKTLRTLQPIASTNMGAGIALIASALDACQAVAPGMKQGVILLTDGHVNMGIVDQGGLLDLVKSAVIGHPGTSVTTVGYGTDHNRDLLNHVATQADGTYNIVVGRDDVAGAFGSIMGTMISCSAVNARVILPTGSAIRERERRVDTLADGRIAVRLGDLYDGLSATFVASVPAGVDCHTVSLQCYGVAAKSDMEMTTVVTEANAAALEDIAVYGLRQDVSEFVRSCVGDEAEIRTRLEALKTAIEGCVVAGAKNATILGLLRTELEEYEAALARGGGVLRAADAGIFAQHARYLSQGSGTRAVSGPAFVEDPFSTPVSRMVSGAAVRSVTQPVDDDAMSPPVRLARANASVDCSGAAWPPAGGSMGASWPPGMRAGDPIPLTPRPSLSRSVAGGVYPLPPLPSARMYAGPVDAQPVPAGGWPPSMSDAIAAMWPHGAPWEPREE
jgi:Ca-activated chloride channel family protein